MRLTWKKDVAQIAETFPRRSFSVLIFDKITSLTGSAPPVKGDRKAGSRASPARNVAGNDLGLEQKSTCPRSQSSARGSKIECEKLGVESKRLFSPCLRSDATICLAGKPSNTALRMSFPTETFMQRFHA